MTDTTNKLSDLAAELNVTVETIYAWMVGRDVLVLDHHGPGYIFDVGGITNLLRVSVDDEGAGQIRSHFQGHRVTVTG